MLWMRQLRPFCPWQCSLCHCPVPPPCPHLGCISLSRRPPSLFRPISVPLFHPHLNFRFPYHSPPPPPAETFPGSLFRARFLLRPQKGDGFCRPRTRMGRMLMSFCASLLRCTWSGGSQGRAPLPLRLRVLGLAVQPFQEASEP